MTSRRVAQQKAACTPRRAPFRAHAWHWMMALLAPSWLACSGTRLSHTIDDKQLRDMSRQGQLWVFDAENEVVVALDQLDEARDTLRDVQRRLKLAEAAKESAERRDRPLAVRVAEAQIEFLEALESWAEEDVQLRRLGVTVARAMVELAKAQVVRREDLLGGKNFSLKDYQKQHDDLLAEAQSLQKQVNQSRREARTKEAGWWRMRRQYTAQTGDYDTGLWID